MRLPIQVDAGGGEGGGAGGAQVTISFELLSNKFTLPVRVAVRPKVAIGELQRHPTVFLEERKLPFRLRHKQHRYTVGDVWGCHRAAGADDGHSRHKSKKRTNHDAVKRACFGGFLVESDFVPAAGKARLECQGGSRRRQRWRQGEEAQGSSGHDY